MIKPDDRRDDRRYYYRALLQIAESSEYINIELEAINISAGGIFFRSTQLLDINKKITLVFNLPGLPRPVEAYCTVVHNLETIPGRQYFIGAQFNKLLGVMPDELLDHFGENFE